MQRALVVLGSLVLSIALCASALAQDPSPSCRTVERGRRREIVCEELVIQGRAPSASVLLGGRARDRHEAPELRRTLAPEVARTVMNAPF